MEFGAALPGLPSVVRLIKFGQCDSVLRAKLAVYYGNAGCYLDCTWTCAKELYMLEDGQLKPWPCTDTRYQHVACDTKSAIYDVSCWTCCLYCKNGQKRR